MPRRQDAQDIKINQMLKVITVTKDKDLNVERRNQMKKHAHNHIQQEA